MSAGPLIAVVGATGQQGGGVVRALQAAGRFRVRALTRNPGQHRALADEVFTADLDRPETLAAAFQGVHGVFLVTNFWEPGTDEREQAGAAIRAARDAGVTHFIWSTLPNVEEISGGTLEVPHFTGKAKVDPLVRDAGFANYTYVIPPFYYQSLTSALAPQKQADGSLGWAIPLDPAVRCIHMGDINELGYIVAGAFAHPEQAGHGEYLPLVGDFLSFNDIVETLNRQGHHFSVTQAPPTGWPPEIVSTFRWFQSHTYLGFDSADRIELANRIAGRKPTPFAAWARMHFPVPEGAST